MVVVVLESILVLQSAQLRLSLIVDTVTPTTTITTATTTTTTTTTTIIACSSATTTAEPSSALVERVFLFKGEDRMSHGARNADMSWHYFDVLLDSLI
jgi:hypothetical protein